jgi:hypothetical protein
MHGVEFQLSNCESRLLAVEAREEFRNPKEGESLPF